MILTSKHPDRFDVLEFLLDRHDHLQNKLWKLTKVEPPTLDDNVPEGDIRDYIYFIYKLRKPVVHKQDEYDSSMVI